MLGFMAALLVRLALARGWIGAGIELPPTYPAMVRSLLTGRPAAESWAAFSGNVFAGFRWAWWIPLVAVGVLWRGGQWRDALLFLGTMLTTVVLSVAVFDVARSVAFLLPGVVLGVAGLSRLSGWRLEPALRVTVWLCLLTPAYWISSGFYFWWWRPLPLRLAAYLSGSDPLAGWWAR